MFGLEDERYEMYRDEVKKNEALEQKRLRFNVEYDRMKMCANSQIDGMFDEIGKLENEVKHFKDRATEAEIDLVLIRHEHKSLVSHLQDVEHSLGQSKLDYKQLNYSYKNLVKEVAAEENKAIKDAIEWIDNQWGTRCSCDRTRGDCDFCYYSVQDLLDILEDFADGNPNNHPDNERPAKSLETNNIQYLYVPTDCAEMNQHQWIKETKPYTGYELCLNCGSRRFER